MKEILIINKFKVPINVVDWKKSQIKWENGLFESFLLFFFGDVKSKLKQ